MTSVIEVPTVPGALAAFNLMRSSLVIRSVLYLNRPIAMIPTAIGLIRAHNGLEF